MRRKKEILKNLNKKKIVVLKGGWSSERKVSLKTGENIKNALKSLGLRVVGLDLKKDFFEKLKRIKPDILVKGGDWKQDKIVGNELVKKVYRVKLCSGHSTTSIINKIKKSG